VQPNATKSAEKSSNLPKPTKGQYCIIFGAKESKLALGGNEDK